MPAQATGAGVLEPPLSGGAFEAARQGEDHRKARRLRDASASFDAALALAPDDLWLLARRASVHAALAAEAQRRRTVHALDRVALERRYAPMLRDLERVLGAWPDDAWTRAQQIEVLLCMKRHGECAHVCTDFLRLVSARDLGGALRSRVWAYQRRARARRWTLDYEGALSDVDRALSLEPAGSWSRGYRGLLLGMMGRLEEAGPDFDAAMTGESPAGEWTLERGLVLAFAGRTSEAAPWLERGLAREDGYLGHYFLATACEEAIGDATRHAQAARAAAESLLETEARTLAEYLLGGLAARAGEVEQAVHRLRGALTGDEMMLEIFLSDPSTRPLAAHPSLRPLVEALLEALPQALKYLVRRSEGT